MNMDTQEKNNLIKEAQKEIEAEERETEKKKIRAMLELIKMKEKEIDDKTEEVEKLKESLRKGDYSAVRGAVINTSSSLTYSPFGVVPTTYFISL